MGNAILTRTTLPAYTAEFWLRAKPTDGGCWEWTELRHRQGYGDFTVHPEVGERYAHRIAWALIHGPVPEGLVVRHRCDNPPCVNPAHLRTGTQSENMEDMRKRGRAYRGRGQQANASKLTDDDVRDMFRLRELGEPYKAIGRLFGVTGTRVWQIVNKGEWNFTS